MSNTDRWFFDQDVDGHWYLIPAKLLIKWQHSKLDGEYIDDDNFFVQYMFGGGPHQVVFSNPEV